ncbi:DUF6497 family protein [Pseudothioclava nitratireducens]|uniref:DUF6497 family protein n=1 Tax=Pseudothioclava nitratireducens TaxID=1928646 RepID=UPI0023DC0288|nr:DUF6497 family protein [Defluviimonas nitratireducens]MDF1620243.1 DUF6497 family protein [Defluviimonas nitratireducens]
MSAGIGRARHRLAGGVFAALAVALPVCAQELRELPVVPDYSLFMHPDDTEQGDGPAGTFGKAVPVPSGQKVWWIDIIHFEEGSGGLTYRFRFLAPQIGGAAPLSSDVALLDIAALCETYVVPRIATPGPAPIQIMISLSDRILPFGETAPDAVQYFEAFSIADGACTWEFY